MLMSLSRSLLAVSRTLLAFSASSSLALSRASWTCNSSTSCTRLNTYHTLAHREITPKRAKNCRLLNLLLSFFWLSALCVRNAHMNVRWFKKEGGHISVVMSLFVLLHNSHFMNKLQFNDFLTINNQQ